MAQQFESCHNVSIAYKEGIQASLVEMLYGLLLSIFSIRKINTEWSVYF